MLEDSCILVTKRECDKGLRCRASSQGLNGQKEAPECVVTLQAGPSSIRLPVAVEQIEKMKQFLRDVVVVFSEKEEAERPKRWDSVDVRIERGTGVQYSSIELFCNPNAYSSVFDASILVTIHACDGMVVTSEITLEQFKAGILTATAQG